MHDPRLVDRDRSRDESGHAAPGAAALRLVVEHLRSRPDARVLLTSAVPGPDSPLSFYLGQGFRETGQVHEGETVLELDLTA